MVEHELFEAQKAKRRTEARQKIATLLEEAHRVAVTEWLTIEERLRIADPMSVIQSVEDLLSQVRR